MLYSDKDAHIDELRECNREKEPNSTAPLRRRKSANVLRIPRVRKNDVLQCPKLKEIRFSTKNDVSEMHRTHTKKNPFAQKQ